VPRELCPISEEIAINLIASRDRRLPNNAAIRRPYYVRIAICAWQPTHTRLINRAAHTIDVIINFLPSNANSKCTHQFPTRQFNS
jgi:hypothetical protein